MKKIITIVIAILFVNIAYSQNYTNDSFTGTWYGTIESQNYGGYNYETTLILNSDGTYYESSGKLMPSLYPDTQRWEYDEETDRLHFSYLKVVYAGQKTYQHFYFDVVNYSENMMELHYNFWDDPEPNPDAQKLTLSKNPTSVKNEMSSIQKQLIRVTDITGKTLDKSTIGIPLIFQYSDGTIEKRLIIK